MKSIVAVCNDQIEDYLAYGQKAFLLPLRDYSVSYQNTYTLEQIKIFRKKYTDLELFVVINKTIFNEDLYELEKIMDELNSLDIQGIFFYDLALLEIKRRKKLDVNLVWNQTHMVTNSKSCDYYYSKGVHYAVIAGELEKSEILDLVKNTKMKLFYTLLSLPVVAHSRRKLITNYQKMNELEPDHQLLIHEKIGNQDYLVQEEDSGTTFFYQKLSNHYSLLKELTVDYVILNESYMDHQLFLLLLNYTNQYLRNEISFDQLLDFVEPHLDSSAPFLNQKTIYRVKKGGE